MLPSVLRAGAVAAQLARSNHAARPNHCPSASTLATPAPTDANPAHYPYAPRHHPAAQPYLRRDRRVPAHLAISRLSDMPDAISAMLDERCLEKSGVDRRTKSGRLATAPVLGRSS